MTTLTLDSILSGEGGAMPEPDVKNPAPQDDVKTDDQLAAQPGADAGGDQGDGVEEIEHGGRKMVPVQALHGERAKVKRYTEQVESFEKTLKETNEAWERRLNSVLERINPPPAKEPEPAKAPDWFEDPNAAALHTVAPHLQRVQQTIHAQARMLAEIKFTDEAVDAAERAFQEAVESRRIDKADYDKVLSSSNIYAAAVQWHKRQKAQAEIGDDPAAFRAKLEAEIREKLLEEFQQDGGAAPVGKKPPAGVMPSNIAGARNAGNRSAGPAWAGPQPLTSIFKT